MLDTKPRLAVMGAMDEEVHALLNLVDHAHMVSYLDHEFYLGRLKGKDIVLLKSGIGITLAAMTTTLALTQFNVSGLINIGTAGGLSDALKVLDVVVCDRITYHDLDLQAFGHPRSFSNQNRYVFSSNTHYLEVFKTINIPYHIGPLVSGHQFIHEPEQIRQIQHYFPEAIAVEMEGAAIAHVAHQFKCPFIIIRSISDLVHTPKNELNFDEYLKRASLKSAQMTAEFIEAL